jgi:hypothetical protein
LLEVGPLTLPSCAITTTAALSAMRSGEERIAQEVKGGGLRSETR